MTDDLSQCGNCIYHYTYNGRDMCKQVGDDFYLQWKVENCPYHTSITKVAAISDEIYRLKAENAALRERLNITKMALEYACLETLQSNEQYLEELKEKVNKYIKQSEDVVYGQKNGVTFRFAEARIAELKGGSND